MLAPIIFTTLVTLHNWTASFILQLSPLTYTSSVLDIIVATGSCLEGTCQRTEAVKPLQGLAKGLFWYAAHIPARFGIEIGVGDVVGRCSSLVFLLTVPLLRSPQDISPHSYRRPVRTCSMASESRQRYPLADDCTPAILGHCLPERADIQASARV